MISRRRILYAAAFALAALGVLVLALAVSGSLPCLKSATVCAAEAEAAIRSIQRSREQADATLGAETAFRLFLYVLAAVSLVGVIVLHVADWWATRKIVILKRMRTIAHGERTYYEELDAQRSHDLAMRQADASFLSGTTISVRSIATPYGNLGDDPPTPPRQVIEGRLLDDYEIADWMPALPPAPVRPTAPSIEELERSGFVASPDNFVLSFANVNTPVAVDLASAGAHGVIGRPRTGKSTFLRWLIWQARQFGKVAVFDPHGSIVPAAGIAGDVRFANTAAAADLLAAELTAELQVRLDRFAAGEREFVPLVIIADEAIKLSLQSAAAINVIGEAVVEGPKVAIYVILAGQSLPAAVLERQDAEGSKRRIPGSVYRSSLAGIMAFASSATAADMIGFDRAGAQAVASLQQSDKGLMYVAGVCDLTLGAVPNVTLEHLQPLQPARLAASPATSSTPIAALEPATALEAGIDDLEPAAAALEPAGGQFDSNPLTAEEQAVLACWREGLTASAAIARVYGFVGGGTSQQKFARQYAAAQQRVISKLLGGAAAMPPADPGDTTELAALEVGDASNLYSPTPLRDRPRLPPDQARRAADDPHAATNQPPHLAARRNSAVARRRRLPADNHRRGAARSGHHDRRGNPGASRRQDRQQQPAAVQKSGQNRLQQHGVATQHLQRYASACVAVPRSDQRRRAEANRCLAQAATG